MGDTQSTPQEAVSAVIQSVKQEGETAKPEQPKLVKVVDEVQKSFSVDSALGDEERRDSDAPDPGTKDDVPFGDKMDDADKQDDAELNADWVDLKMETRDSTDSTKDTEEHPRDKLFKSYYEKPPCRRPTLAELAATMQWTEPVRSNSQDSDSEIPDPEPNQPQEDQPRNKGDPKGKLKQKLTRGDSQAAERMRKSVKAILISDYLGDLLRRSSSQESESSNTDTELNDTLPGSKAKPSSFFSIVKTQSALQRAARKSLQEEEGKESTNERLAKNEQTAIDAILGMRRRSAPAKERISDGYYDEPPRYKIAELEPGSPRNKSNQDGTRRKSDSDARRKAYEGHVMEPPRYKIGEIEPEAATVQHAKRGNRRAAEGTRNPYRCATPPNSPDGNMPAMQQNLIENKDQNSHLETGSAASELSKWQQTTYGTSSIDEEDEPEEDIVEDDVDTDVNYDVHNEWRVEAETRQHEEARSKPIASEYTYTIDQKYFPTEEPKVRKSMESSAAIQAPDVNKKARVHLETRQDNEVRSKPTASEYTYTIDQKYFPKVEPKVNKSTESTTEKQASAVNNKEREQLEATTNEKVNSKGIANEYTYTIDEKYFPKEEPKVTVSNESSTAETLSQPDERSQDFTYAVDEPYLPKEEPKVTACNEGEVSSTPVEYVQPAEEKASDVTYAVGTEYTQREKPEELKPEEATEETGEKLTAAHEIAKDYTYTVGEAYTPNEKPVETAPTEPKEEPTNIPDEGAKDYTYTVGEVYTPKEKHVEAAPAEPKEEPTNIPDEGAEDYTYSVDEAYMPEVKPAEVTPDELAQEMGETTNMPEEKLSNLSYAVDEEDMQKEKQPESAPIEETSSAQEFTYTVDESYKPTSEQE